MELELRPGEIIGERFSIEHLLGAGGYGAVYLAEQLSMGRKVALKVLHHEYCNDARTSERFYREAQQTSKLCHPNTVVIHDFGVDENHHVLFIAMEFLQGMSLGQELKLNGAISPERTVHIVKQVADSLAEAHDLGLVHRDLKPGNVMLTKRGGDADFVKVIDFGIARAMGNDGNYERRLTDTGVLLGTPYYMAPEQAGTADLDHRVDIYALGVMVYQMLVGKLPFKGQNPIEIIKHHLMTPPPRISEHGDWAPVVDDCLLRAMAKDPTQRYQSIKEFSLALEQALLLDNDATLPATPSRHGPVMRVGSAPLKDHIKATVPAPAVGSPQNSRPKALIAALVGGGVGLLLVIIILLVVTNSKEQEPKDTAEAEPTAQVDDSADLSATQAAADLQEQAPPEIATGPTPEELAKAKSLGSDSSAKAHSSMASLNLNPLLQALDAAHAAQIKIAKEQAEKKLKETAHESASKKDDKPKDKPKERAAKIECQVSVRSWGDVFLDGKAIRQRDQIGWFDSHRGERHTLSLKQEGVEVASKRIKVPESGKCKVTIRR